MGSTLMAMAFPMLSGRAEGGSWLMIPAICSAAPDQCDHRAIATPLRCIDPWPVNPDNH
jgi:hypothetical protein